MNLVKLLLYGRHGCCLCEGLEKKLRELQLDQLSPPLELEVIDIDNEDTPRELKDRYDLLVPVMALEDQTGNESIVLPRVSPRLKGDGLLRWLQRACIKVISS